ncbi:MAG: MATE family efflux transporter [Dehalococcoidales bacterium]|nr:MATE family efflux transporter [Dehalococcoidales bacterium]
MQKHTERLGTAPLGRLLIALSMPGIAASITRSLYNIVDTIWVARLGHEAIAAITVVFPFQILFYAVGGGTSIGVAALVSRRFGEKNIEATNRVAGQIFFLSAFWGLLFMMVAVLFAENILPAMGATPDILEYAVQYLVITSYGAPLMILTIVMSALLRGSGDVVKPMIIVISSTVINIILDPFMIFGIGPFPEMGIAGAAWATVIAQACGALLGLYFIFANKTSFRIKLSYLKPEMSILKDIYRVGAPTAIHEFTESLAFLLFNRVVSSFGSIEIAAFGIIMRISDLAFMPIMGVSHGLLPVVGFNFGAGNFKRLWQAVKMASIGLAIFLALATLFFTIFTPQIIDIFSDDPVLMDIAVPAMRIMLSTLLLVGPTMMFITAFQGLSNGTMALFLSLLRQFLFFVPLLFLFRYLFGLYGVWASMPAADILSFVVTYIFIYREYRKRRHDGAEGGWGAAV